MQAPIPAPAEPRGLMVRPRPPAGAVGTTVTAIGVVVPAGVAARAAGATMNVARTAAMTTFAMPGGVDARWAPLFEPIKTRASCLPERRASARRTMCRRQAGDGARGSGRARAQIKQNRE